MPMNTTLDSRRPVATRASGRPHDLLDDLAGGEVALEAGLAGGAERRSAMAQPAWLRTRSTVARSG